MITKDKVTEIFCIIDEFCKHFDEENAKKVLISSKVTSRRRRAASMSDSEIMTIFCCFTSEVIEISNIITSHS